jgi:hypothetical protein
LRDDQRPNERAVQCPVSGCAQKLTKQDLATDAVLIRQIKRIQRAKELEAEGDDDEVGVNGTTVIEDGDDDAEDVDDILGGRTQVKGEPNTGRAAPQAPTAPP